MTGTALDQEIRHVHDLLFLRDLCADRGVDKEELREYDAAIARARKRLAEGAQSVAAELAA